MQELQKKYGADKFQVLLLSVDGEYDGSVAKAKPKVVSTLKAKSIRWPAAIEPNGWSGIGKTWHVDGYDLILIDQKGQVVKAGYLGDELETLLAKLIK